MNSFQNKARKATEVAGIVEGFLHKEPNERYEYHWDCTWIPVGEKLCVIGDVSYAREELRLMAVYPESLTESFYKDKGWSSKQKAAWKAETKKGGGIFLSQNDAALAISVQPSEFPQPQPVPTPKKTEEGSSNKLKMPSSSAALAIGGAAVAGAAVGAAAVLVAEDPNLVKNAVHDIF